MNCGLKEAEDAICALLWSSIVCSGSLLMAIYIQYMCHTIIYGYAVGNMWPSHHVVRAVLCCSVCVSLCVLLCVSLSAVLLFFYTKYTKKDGLYLVFSAIYMVVVFSILQKNYKIKN
jgi:hypothetical protein